MLLRGRTRDNAAGGYAGVENSQQSGSKPISSVVSVFVPVSTAYRLVPGSPTKQHGLHQIRLSSDQKRESDLL